MAIEFEKARTVALLSEGGGYTKELCLVSWNGQPAKYDIRRWSENGAKPGKGITLTDLEAALLYDALDAEDIGKPSG